MNKGELEKLGHLIAERKTIEAEIAALEKELLQGSRVADTVTGSAVAFPYTKRVYSIVGADQAEAERIYGKIRKRQRRLEKKKQECEQEYEALTQYIESIDDPYLRRILLYRYREGHGWETVASLIGGGNSADSIRMNVTRFLKK